MTLKKISDDSQYLSISDLMSGLMIVFLFIAVCYMENISQSKKKITNIAVTYNEIQVNLYDKLLKEFKDDLPKWGANIDKQTLSIRFFEPEILFSAGMSTLTPRFKIILDDFFPRYIAILFSDEFRDSIEEIRIEGHTSSEWDASSSDTDIAYFNNMRLSQERTLSVLQYCTMLIHETSTKDRMRSLLTANGLSSSKLVYLRDGTEDKTRSRRVEFRTRTNAEQRIVQILEEIKDF